MLDTEDRPTQEIGEPPPSLTGPVGSWWLPQSR